MTFVLWLHIAAAILTIGPVMVAVAASPRAIRGGTESLALLRWFRRTTRIYGLASIVVFLLGMWLASTAKDAKLGSGWVSTSMGLYVVAFVLLVVVQHDQSRAVTKIEAGEPAAVEAGRIAAFGGISALLFLAILGLMVWQPGGHHTQSLGAVVAQLHPSALS